jgi:protein-tyrosine phosphatase
MSDDVTALLLKINPLVKGQMEVPMGTLLFGRMWSSWESSAIEDEIRTRKIDVIFNLLEESHGDINGAKEIWSPIDDYDIPSDIESFMSKVSSVIEELCLGKTVFVHCFGGVGRTSLALASILVKLGTPAAEALDRVHELARGPETEEQKIFVRNL